MTEPDTPVEDTEFLLRTAPHRFALCLLLGDTSTRSAKELHQMRDGLSATITGKSVTEEERGARVELCILRWLRAHPGLPAVVADLRHTAAQVCADPDLFALATGFDPDVFDPLRKPPAGLKACLAAGSVAALAEANATYCRDLAATATAAMLAATDDERSAHAAFAEVFAARADAFDLFAADPSGHQRPLPDDLLYLAHEVPTVDRTDRYVLRRGAPFQW